MSKERKDCLNWEKPMTSRQAASYLMTKGFIAAELHDVEIAELQKRNTDLELRLKKYDLLYPAKCPITGLPFFMLIEDEEGNTLPTYGGPYDSYTIPERDEDGSYSHRRYDHDLGGWIEGWEVIPIIVKNEDEWYKLENRIKDLEAIVAKLPHTVDGVPVYPGMMVWGITAANQLISYEAVATGCGWFDYPAPVDGHPKHTNTEHYDVAWSTRELALAELNKKKAAEAFKPGDAQNATP